MRSMLDENFISSDAGNGWAACYRMVGGKVKTHGIPHARARVTGARLNADIGSQNIAEYADFMGQRYGYGDHIWDLTDAPIDLHQNTARRYGGNMHIFLLLVNIASLGVKSGSELTLIVPAPPGMLNEVGPVIKKSILDGENGQGDGVWSIQLRKDKKPREYRFIRVITIPEGAGAFAAYRFDLNGDAVELLDRQALTCSRACRRADLVQARDTYTIFDGSLNPDAIAHATDDRAGVISNVLRPILGEVMQAVPEAKHLTTAHIDSVLRRYVKQPSQEAATIRVSGKNINLEKTLLSTCERYAEWIAANKLDPLWASGVDAVVEAGGAWLYIENWVKSWYPDRLLLTPAMFPHTRNIALFDLNGVGQLSFAAAVMKMQQA